MFLFRCNSIILSIVWLCQWNTVFGFSYSHSISQRSSSILPNLSQHSHHVHTNTISTPLTLAPALGQPTRIPTQRCLHRCPSADRTIHYYSHSYSYAHSYRSSRTSLNSAISPEPPNSASNGPSTSSDPIGSTSESSKSITSTTTATATLTPPSTSTTTTASTSTTITESKHETTENGPLSTIKSTLLEKVGSIDENRLIYPEIVSREVPRVFSNLSYQTTQDSTTGKNTIQSATHSSGSMIGSALLVAGTTLGAGVLALPTATAPAGLLPSTAAIFVAWFYMTISGLLIAELSINRIGETGRLGLGLLELYKSSLGENWARLGSAAYFFLHYTVMVAYIAQGGTNVGGILDGMGLSSISNVMGVDQLLFAGTIGSLIYFGRTSDWLEKLNNLMVAGVFTSFVAIMGLGVGNIDVNAMIAPVNQHPEKVVDAFPILFLSMVFHSVVPTIVTQLEGDAVKIRNAILIGTSIPLFMFLGWNTVILGNALNVPGGLDSGVNPIDLISQAGAGGAGGDMIGGLVGTFSILAIVTSMIGMFYGLLDALTDFLDVPTSGPKYEEWKPVLFAAGFIPPLIFSVGNPDIFFDALDYGGAFGVSTLFLVLPPIMVWKLRYNEEKPLMVPPMVPLGKIPLAGLWKAAGTLILEQGADKLGVFDFIKAQWAQFS